MGAITFSIDPRLVLKLKEVLPLEIFVETGTFEGDTLEQVLGLFRECHSVELSKELAEQARVRLLSATNVQIVQGDSVEFLRQRAPILQSNSVLYWLDAHWCASDHTAGKTSQCPLIEELRAIGSLNGQSVILVDDARLFICPPPTPHEVSHWPSFDAILAALRDLSEQHEVMVINDIVAFYPRKYASTLTSFAYRYGVNWLEIKHSADLIPQMRGTIESLTNTNASLKETISSFNDTITKEQEYLQSELKKKLELRKKLQLAKARINNLRTTLSERRPWWQPKIFSRKATRCLDSSESFGPTHSSVAPLGNQAFVPLSSTVPVVETQTNHNSPPNLPLASPEAEMTHVFERIAADKQIDVIFDVGANEGQTMLNLTVAFPAARIFSFEPFPEAFARLQENATAFPNVHSFQTAAGERDGVCTLFLHKASVVNSLLPTSQQAAGFSPPGWTVPVGSIEVPIVRLDTFCKTHQIPRVDLLKIDSQGYESGILDGASDLLHKQRIGFVYLEVIFVPLYDGQATFEEIFAKFRSHGYDFVDLFEKNTAENGSLKWCNALFCAPWAKWSGQPGGHWHPGNRTS